MTWLLDTDVCIGLLRGRLPKSAARLQTLPRAEVVLCSVVIYELYLGVEKCSQPATEGAKVRAFIGPFSSLPFDDECARHCAQIRADLEKAGASIGPYDYQIAAICQRHGLTLVSRNATEFTRVRGLKVEDWES